MKKEPYFGKMPLSLIKKHAIDKQVYIYIYVDKLLTINFRNYVKILFLIMASTCVSFHGVEKGC